LIPALLVGTPLPFKIVLGIEVALRPAAVAGSACIDVAKNAITNRAANRVGFTGDLQVFGM
jgi:hypothetical protein